MKTVTSDTFLLRGFTSASSVSSVILTGMPRTNALVDDAALAPALMFDFVRPVLSCCKAIGIYWKGLVVFWNFVDW